MKITNAKNKKRFGFTLIELLVAVSLFSIAVSIAAGGFVRALQTQRQLIALISANSSASLAIEQMAREIRTGFNFSCTTGVGGFCEELAFTNSAGQDVVYSLEDGILEKVTAGGAPEALTPDNTSISELSFLLNTDPLYPPRITIAMSVTAESRGLEDSATNLQTTISSRNF